jgi:hypothetical protein
LSHGEYGGGRDGDRDGDRDGGRDGDRAKTPYFGEGFKFDFLISQRTMCAEAIWGCSDPKIAVDG